MKSDTTSSASSPTLDDPSFAKAIAEAAPDLLFVIDLRAMQTVYANRDFAPTMGFASETAHLSTAEFLRQHMHPDDQAELSKWIGSFDSLSDGEIVTHTYRLRDVTDQWRWFQSLSRVFRRDEHGKPTHIIGSARDITSAKAVDRELLANRERTQVVLDAVGDCVISVSRDGIIDYVNTVAEEMIGIARHQIIGMLYEDVVRITDGQGRTHVRHPLATCLSSGQRVDWLADYVLISRQGKKLHVELAATPLLDSGGQVTGAVLAIHDVSAATEMARQLVYHAAHDALTGLVNRREFESKLEQALVQSKRTGAEHVLCYLDLDQFKLVNDTCGHIAGDELLRQLAVLLRRKVKNADVLARLGGDEFGLLLFDQPLEEALVVADGFRRVIREFRFAWEGRVFEIGVSMGVVRITPQSESVSGVLSAADVACYAAKDLGRNRIHVYEPNDAELLRRRGEMQWTGDIVRALEADRFTLYFQAIRPLDGNPDDVHAEFLLRMLDEENNVIPPGAFIPAAERYNLMPAIDRWVVRHVLKALSQAFRDDAIDCARGLFAINISGTSLSDDGFLDYVRQQFRRYEVPPHRICFEITETAAISNLAKAMAFINALRELGCRFALDDFGSGLSSFSYLKNLPVDFLKIDGAFIRDMVDDRLDAAMVRSIIDIAQVLGVKTVAEFVENQRVFGALGDAGIDFAQGYFCASPQPLTSLRVLKEALAV